MASGENPPQRLEKVRAKGVRTIHGARGEKARQVAIARISGYGTRVMSCHLKSGWFFVFNSRLLNHLRRRDHVGDAVSFGHRTERSRFWFSGTITTNSITRDTRGGRDFETLGLEGGSGGGSGLSRATDAETLAAKDVCGTRCGSSRFDEKSHRVSTVAFRITGR